MITKERLLFIMLAAMLCNGCGGLKTLTLLNGVTEVPKDTVVYANRVKFDASILSVIDTNVIYERYDTYRKTLSRLATDDPSSLISVLRFYPNGCFNKFWFNKNEPFNPLFLNPDYSGERGVYYMERGGDKFDLFCPVNQVGTMGKLTGTITVKGDTLYLVYPKIRTEVYVKRSLSAEFLQFEGSW